MALQQSGLFRTARGNSNSQHCSGLHAGIPTVSTVPNCARELQQSGTWPPYPSPAQTKIEQTKIIFPALIELKIDLLTLARQTIGAKLGQNKPLRFKLTRWSRLEKRPSKPACLLFFPLFFNRRPCQFFPFALAKQLRPLFIKQDLLASEIYWPENLFYNTPNPTASFS